MRQGRGKPQDCPFRYQGQYEDVETGLYYNRFRYYDPEAGSYISQDPAGLKGGWEFYAYVKDPCTWIDPFGLARIHTSGNVAVSAYPGPAVGGIEYAPLHAHVVEGKAETRVLMEDYIKKGKVVARKGEVYPGDPEMSKSMKKVVGELFDDLASKTKAVCGKSSSHLHQVVAGGRVLGQ